MRSAADVCTRSSGYVVIVFVLYLPVFCDGVLFVGGKDDSVIRRRIAVYRLYQSNIRACPVGYSTEDIVESSGREVVAVAK